jgi:lipopolysaccharide export system protein LptA
MKAASPGPGGAQQIRRLEARGGVTVTQKDQTATGDTGLFDMQANTVTLVGNVVVSQGRNVIRGSKLVVDLTSGVSRVEGGKSNGRVEMLFENKPAPPNSPSGPPQRLGPPRPLSSN